MNSLESFGAALRIIDKLGFTNVGADDGFVIRPCTISLGPSTRF